jgi:hypothetical protein
LSGTKLVELHDSAEVQRRRYPLKRTYSKSIGCSLTDTRGGAIQPAY